MAVTNSSHQDAEAGRLVFWGELQTQWPALPRPVRQALLTETAALLHRQWRQGLDVSSFRLDLLAFSLLAEGARVKSPLPRQAGRREPIPHARVMSLLADWYLQAREVLSARECAAFLVRFLRAEPTDRATLRHAAGRVVETAGRRALLQAQGLHAQTRSEHGPAGRPLFGKTQAGFWGPYPRLPARELALALGEAETDERSVTVKSERNIRVFRTVLLGQDVMVKRYDLHGPLRKLKYAYRLSRACRAFCIAETLRKLGVPTPAPLGYLDLCTGRIPVRSYFVASYIADACPLRTWAEASYAKESEPGRVKLRQDLLESLVELYRKGIYHSDTKASNILLQYPEEPERRGLLWTDLECVKFGAWASRHRVVRNLVQLNGSLAQAVPKAERRLFLGALARRVPELGRPWDALEIHGWTAWRLFKERVGWAGP